MQLTKLNLQMMIINKNLKVESLKLYVLEKSSHYTIYIITWKTRKSPVYLSRSNRTLRSSGDRMRLDSPNKWERPSSKNMGFMFSNPKTPLHDTNIIITIITFNPWLIHKRYIESLIFLGSLQTRNKEKSCLVFLFLCMV